jgi:hypothetical protein
MGWGDLMSAQTIFLPLFVEVILSFALLFTAAALRGRDLNSGQVRREHIALREPNWTKRTLQFGYAFANQLELPVLFYVLTILAYVTHHAGYLFVVLAWVFVIFRLLHAYIHVTSNDVRRRGPLFGVSALVLAIMWVIYMVEMLTSPWV